MSGCVAPLSFSILNDVDVKSEKVCTVNPGALFVLRPSILKHEGKATRSVVWNSGCTVSLSLLEST